MMAKIVKTTTSQEQINGYTDAISLKEPKTDKGDYALGYRIGLNDKMNIVQDFQLEIIRKLREEEAG